MIGPYAEGIIAVMATGQSRQNQAIGQFIGDAVS